MDMDVCDDLILGWDWISSHALRHFYVDVSLRVRSGPARLQMDLLRAEARPPARAMSVLSHGGLRRPHRRFPMSWRGDLRRFRPRLLRPRIAARLGGPGRSTRTTLSSRLSRLRSGWQLAPGGTRIARLTPGVATTAPMAWRYSRTAPSSTWRPSAWQTRSCASPAPKTRRSRRSRSSTRMCWAGPHPACRLIAAWSSSSRQATRGSRGPGR